MFNRSRALLSVSIAGLIAGLGTMNDKMLQAVRAVEQLPRTRRRDGVRRLQLHRGGCYTPHQGPRECARRIGGDHWKAWLAGDRVRRGLPATK